MNEMSRFINHKGKFSTAILSCPNGRFTLVGSVPAELTKPTPNSLTPGARDSMVWDTEQEVIDALLTIGIDRFQLSNCKWYQV